MEEELKYLDWDDDGSHSIEPGNDIKKNGYPQGAAPPTEHFNWIFRTIDKCLKLLGKMVAANKKQLDNILTVEEVITIIDEERSENLGELT